MAYRVICSVFQLLLLDCLRLLKELRSMTFLKSILIVLDVIFKTDSNTVLYRVFIHLKVFTDILASPSSKYHSNNHSPFFLLKRQRIAPSRTRKDKQESKYIVSYKDHVSILCVLGNIYW